MRNKDYQREGYTDDVKTKVRCAERNRMSREEKREFKKMLTNEKSNVILKLIQNPMIC